MESEIKVVFAKKNMEDGYKKLADSWREEDRTLYLKLTRIRKQVQRELANGEEIPSTKIPDVYKQMFNVGNLWKLKVSADESVFYSISDEEILIVDLV